MILDKCITQNNKELICTITRANIEEILAYNGEIFNIGALINSYGTYYFINTVLSIKFNYDNITKEDIYVDIIELKENVAEKNHLIAYETEIVANINNVITESFKLNFNNYGEAVCFFKKSENTNLLLLCRFVYEGTYSLKSTQEQIVLNDINIMYNFIILPIHNVETFNITGDYNTFIFTSHPKVLNLTNQNSELLSFTLPSNNLDWKIKLNPIANDDLICNNKLGLLNCIVPLSHFDYEEEGYYNMYYTNSRGDLSIYYEVTPFKVILPERHILKMRIKQEDNQKTIEIGQKGTLYFITNYNDNETNIFDSSDIEENTKFETTIFDDEENTYDVNCRLFRPTNEKIVIICNLNENLNKTSQNITLSKVRLTYKEYNITIYSDTSIKVNQLNYPIPFIYSDKQIINMNDETEEYELKFKYDSYKDNDLLFIYGTQYDFTSLENCENTQNEIICKISKEKLESILTYNNEIFSLGNMNDNIGRINFNLVYDININYEIPEKENITVTITKLLNNATEYGTPIAYETDIDTIPVINTRLFILKFNNTDDGFCYFKKNKDNNLIMVCIILGLGEKALGKIDQEIYLDEIHYKYNFIILPVENNEIITQICSFPRTRDDLEEIDVRKFLSKRL